MKANLEMEVTEVVRILTTLFPKQHKQAGVWLAGLKSNDRVANDRDAAKSLEKEPTYRPNPQRRPQQTNMDPNRSSATNHPPVQQVKQRLALPTSVRIWTGTIGEWGNRQRNDDMSSDQERKRVASVIDASGLTDWHPPGFLTKLICLATDIKKEPDRVIEIEMFVPRSESGRALLISIWTQGCSKHFFEINIVDLRSDSLPKMVEFVVN